MTAVVPGDLADRLQQGLNALGVALTQDQQQQLLSHVALVSQWNHVYNLTAVRDLPAMLSHHVLDSVAAVPAFTSMLSGIVQPSLLDVGSGAGFPGVPVAIALPGCDVTCVDKVGKKASFIQNVRNRLSLSNLHGVHARVETLRPKPWQVIMSRAFASLAEFTVLTEPLLADRGCWAAWKARVSDDELAAVHSIAEVFHVEHLLVPGLDATRCVVWMRRHGAG